MHVSSADMIYEKFSTLRTEDVHTTCRYLFPSPHQEEHGLIPAPTFQRNHLVSPHVMRGKDMMAYMEASHDSLSIQPCSIDIILKAFTNASGRGIRYPVVIQPGEKIVGHSGMNYKGADGASLCVETRSSTARKGLVCMGFYPGNRIFLSQDGELSFVLRNYSPNALVVEEPFSPVQVSVTKNMRVATTKEPAVRIFKRGMDVTEECRVQIGNFTSYAVSLAEDLAYYRKSGKPVSLNNNGIEEYIVRTKVHDVDSNPGFCLTMTKEEIRTNGCPAYIFPFHHRDTHIFPVDDIGELSSLFFDVFSNENYMPVTANAGLINPGNSGRIVFENITEGRDWYRYFRVGEPFGLVIPVPFMDGSLDHDGYNGSHKDQKEITL